MTWAGLLERVGQRISITPGIAVAAAAALLVASLIFAAFNEREGDLRVARQASFQAEILAASVAAPIAFDDRSAAQQYVDALRANREILAAGAYDLRGERIAGFVRGTASLPRTNHLSAPVRQTTC